MRTSALETWRRTGSAPRQAQLVVSRARVAEARRAGRAGQRRRRTRATRTCANATIKAPIRATVLTRDVELGSPVSSILNLGANATLVMTLGDIHAGLRARQGRRSRHRPVRLGQPARITVETFKDKVLRRPRHADLADRRREGQRHHLRGEGVDRERAQASSRPT